MTIESNGLQRDEVNEELVIEQEEPINDSNQNLLIEQSRRDLHRQRTIEGIRQKWNDPDWSSQRRQSMSREGIERWENNPEWREKILFLFNGRERTPEQREGISQRATERYSHSEARDLQSERHGGRRSQAAALYLRHFVIDQVVTLLDLSKEQARNVKANLRRSNELPKLTKQEEKIEQTRGIKVKLDFTADTHEEHFLRGLLYNGYFDRDLQYWTRLTGDMDPAAQNMFTLFNWLRRDALWKLIDSGDVDLLKAYRQMGLDVDPIWFQKTLSKDLDSIFDICEQEYNQRTLTIDDIYRMTRSVRYLKPEIEKPFF